MPPFGVIFHRRKSSRDPRSELKLSDDLAAHLLACRTEPELEIEPFRTALPGYPQHGDAGETAPPGFVRHRCHSKAAVTTALFKVLNVEAPDPCAERADLILGVEVAHDEPHHAAIVENQARPSGLPVHVSLGQGLRHWGNESLLPLLDPYPARLRDVVCGELRQLHRGGWMRVMDSGHVNERIKNRPQFSPGCQEQAGNGSVEYSRSAGLPVVRLVVDAVAIRAVGSQA